MDAATPSPCATTRLDGLRVLITGASQGIGRAIAVRAAAEGADVAVCASAPSERLHDVAVEIEGLGRRAITLSGDLADPTIPSRLVADAAAELGGLDAVVANAGVAIPAPLAEPDVSAWDRVLAINLRATWLLGAAALPMLAGGGSVVAVGSISGHAPHPGMGAYSVSKAALAMLIRQMAQEWAGLDVRANLILPGFTLTPRTEPVYRDDKLREQRTAMVPLGRLASSESDVAGTAVFLLSKDAAYCTGQALAVDGGVADSIFRHDPRALTSHAPPGTPS